MRLLEDMTGCHWMPQVEQVIPFYATAGCLCFWPLNAKPNQTGPIKNGTTYDLAVPPNSAWMQPWSYPLLLRVEPLITLKKSDACTSVWDGICFHPFTKKRFEIYRQGYDFLIKICPVKVVAFRWVKVWGIGMSHGSGLKVQSHDSNANLSDEPSWLNVSLHAYTQ